MPSILSIIILAASLTLALPGIADAKRRVDPDFILIGCLNDNGVSKSVEFARKFGPRKTWETIAFSDYILSPIMKISPIQTKAVEECFEQTLAKYR